jgi:hypothetical protein
VASDGAVRLRTEWDITHDLKPGFSVKRGDKMCAQDNVVVHNAMRMSVLAVADLSAIFVTLLLQSMALSNMPWHPLKRMA